MPPCFAPAGTSNFQRGAHGALLHHLEPAFLRLSLAALRRARAKETTCLAQRLDAGRSARDRGNQPPSCSCLGGSDTCPSTHARRRFHRAHAAPSSLRASCTTWSRALASFKCRLRFLLPRSPLHSETRAPGQSQHLVDLLTPIFTGIEHAQTAGPARD